MHQLKVTTEISSTLTKLNGSSLDRCRVNFSELAKPMHHFWHHNFVLVAQDMSCGKTIMTNGWNRMFGSIMYHLLLTTMAIALDRCIQKTYPTATRNLECSPSLGEMVVLKVKPGGLWRTASSSVHSQPSPVDDTKSSVTQRISSPSAEIFLLDDFSKFIQARDPGAYKVTLDLPFYLPRTHTSSRNSTQWRLTTSFHSKMNWI